MLTTSIILTETGLFFTILLQRMSRQKLRFVNNTTVGIAHFGTIVILHGLIGRVDQYIWFVG